MKNKKILYGAIATIVLGSYLVFRYIQKNKPSQVSFEEDKIIDSIKNSSQGVSNPNLETLASFPLKNGSKGKQVAILQKWLNDGGYADVKLVEDGVFGSKTESAVRKMQQFPNQKQILDYNTFNVSFLMGQVTKDFYDIFVIKSKPIPQLGGGILGL